MLHLIFQSPINISVMQRIDSGDGVVFLENAVFRVNKASMLENCLGQMLKNNIHLYVLNEDLETRGINDDDLVSGIAVTDYSGLVKLTEENKVVRTWS